MKLSQYPSVAPNRASPDDHALSPQIALRQMMNNFHGVHKLQLNDHYLGLARLNLCTLSILTWQSLGQ